MPRKRVGILISDRGSNMSTLIEACKSDDFPAEIAVVISNRPDAPGLESARAEGIAAMAIDHTGFATREAFEAQLDASLRDNGIELICNAGFMRLLTESFVKKWFNLQLNIHPSLLPSYPGVHTHDRVIVDGVRISGCTVHFLRTDMDIGPIIIQAAVPVLPDDDAATLAARVLDAEHRIYPVALRLVASGVARVVDEKVILNRDTAIKTPHELSLISPQF